MEETIIQGIQSFQSPFLDFIMQFATILGEQYLLILIAAAIYWCYDKEEGMQFIFIAAFSAICNTVIKGIVKRSRPNFQGLRKLRSETATGFSFPSGHSQNISTMFSAIYLGSKKTAIIYIGVFVSLFVGISRIYCGAHYPSDVIFGIIFGVLFSYSGFLLYKLVKNKMHLFAGIILFFLPFAWIFFSVPITETTPNMADFFKLYGLFCGITLGYYLEHKFINFNCDNLSKKTKIVRFVFGIIFVAMVYLLLKLFLPTDYIFSFIRYFFVSLTVLALVPAIFKKLKL